MVEQVRQLRHWRIPVYDGYRDALVGMLHAEALMRRVLEDRDLSQVQPQDILHPVIMVPPTKKVDEMLGFLAAVLPAGIRLLASGTPRRAPGGCQGVP